MSTSTPTATRQASETRNSPGRRSVFTPTHWSVVLAAGHSDTTHAHAALARLCQTYWFPLYAYVRRRGHSPHDAQDLTQEFFARRLERDDLARVRPEKGKFRSFLLASMNHFLADAWDKARARKRAAGRTVPLDAAAAETRYLQQPADTLAPEKLFERRWALAVLEQTHARLRQEYERDGKGALFDALRFSLMGERSAVPYAELARQLDLSEGAVKVAVHRLRQRYRKTLRSEIENTVSSSEDVEEELRELMRALSSG